MRNYDLNSCLTRINEAAHRSKFIFPCGADHGIDVCNGDVAYHFLVGRDDVTERPERIDCARRRLVDFVRRPGTARRSIVRSTRGGGS